jgi:hypothetical protein
MAEPALEHFPPKWTRFGDKKMRQTNESRAHSGLGLSASCST